MRRRITWTAIAAAALLIALPATARPDVPEYGEDYASGQYARVSFRDPSLTVERYDSEIPVDDEINAPVYPGDRVLTRGGERGEIQLADGLLVRIDERSELTFAALPDPYAEFKDNTVLQLAYGAIRLSGDVDEDEELRIDTPAASIYLLSDTDVRIEVLDGGRTRVVSRRGVAEVVAEQGSVLVRSGMSTDVYPGSTPARPVTFNTFYNDRFDSWVEDRENAYRVRDRYEYREAYEALPYEVRPYARELSAHGSWRHVGDYGWVWSPTVRASWRPYSDGYWHYGPRGYFWVARESWGWAPYRYGRWGYIDNRWCWIPGRVFGGAWVAWSYGSAHVGWAPLGYYDRPVVVASLSFGYCPRSWSFVHHTHFHRRHYRDHYLGLNRVGHHVRGHRVVTRAARVSPRAIATHDGVRRARQVADRVPARYDARREGDRRRAFRAGERTGFEDRVRASATRAGMNAPERRGKARAVRGATDPRGEARARAGRGGRQSVEQARPSTGRGRQAATRPSRARDPQRSAELERSSARKRGGREATTDRGRSVQRDRRDLYEQMTSPRPRARSNDRPGTEERARGRESARPRTQPRATEGRSRPTREAERPSRERSTPRATPQPRERRSTPKATPRSGSRQAPRAERPSRQRSAPRATPQPRERRSTPKATPRSGSRQAPRAERPSRQRSAPRATPQTRERRSTPKATPRSGSRQAPRAERPSRQRSAPRATPRSSGSRSTPKPKSSDGKQKRSRGRGR